MFDYSGSMSSGLTQEQQNDISKRVSEIMKQFSDKDFILTGTPGVGKSNFQKYNPHPHIISAMRFNSETNCYEI